MTSTSIYQGMDSDAKPSSRVLAPPGGGSSNIFGTPAPVKPAPPKETAPAQPAQSQPAPPQNATGRSIKTAPKQEYNLITGQPIYSAKTKPQQGAAASGGDNAEENVTSPPAPAAEGEKTSTKDKENVTSPGVKPKPAEGVKSSTRVAQPPGGKCSGPLW